MRKKGTYTFRAALQGKGSPIDLSENRSIKKGGIRCSGAREGDISRLPAQEGSRLGSSLRVREDNSKKGSCLHFLKRDVSPCASPKWKSEASILLEKKSPILERKRKGSVYAEAGKGKVNGWEEGSGILPEKVKKKRKKKGSAIEVEALIIACFACADNRKRKGGRPCRPIAGRVSTSAREKKE